MPKNRLILDWFDFFFSFSFFPFVRLGTWKYVAACRRLITPTYFNARSELTCSEPSTRDGIPQGHVAARCERGLRVLKSIFTFSFLSPETWPERMPLTSSLLATDGRLMERRTISMSPGSYTTSLYCCSKCCPTPDRKLNWLPKGLGNQTKATSAYQQYFSNPFEVTPPYGQCFPNVDLPRESS